MLSRPMPQLLTVPFVCQVVSGSLTIEVEAGPVDPAKTLLIPQLPPPAATASSLSTLQLILVDSTGVGVSDVTAVNSASLSGPETVPVLALVGYDGSHALQYSLSIAGQYQVQLVSPLSFGICCTA